MSDTESPLRISVRPEEGSSLDIVVLDVGQELPLEIERREDDPASDAIPLQFAKPQLHLIEPGAVGRRVVQVCTRGCRASQACTSGVLWAERLSAMTWISLRRRPRVACSRNHTNSTVLCRGTHFPRTRPQETSRAAYRDLGILRHLLIRGFLL